MYMHTWLHMNTYIYTFIYACMHTFIKHTYTYMNACIHRCRQRWGLVRHLRVAKSFTLHTVRSHALAKICVSNSCYFSLHYVSLFFSRFFMPPVIIMILLNLLNFSDMLWCHVPSPICLFLSLWLHHSCGLLSLSIQGVYCRRIQ